MHFLGLQHKYAFPEFYTDASKSSSGVSYAAVGPSFSEANVLHPQTSIFTGEAYALLSAVKHIKGTKIPKSVIYTDSLSVVNALTSFRRQRNSVMVTLYHLLCNVYASGHDVVVCGVPGHREIAGNVLADQLATSVEPNPRDMSMSVVASDMKPYIRKCLRTYWQQMWDSESSNKLHVIRPRIGNMLQNSKNRCIQVTFCRLRIGHTYETHSYLLSGGEPPTCSKCRMTLTVLHVLVECRELEAERKKHFALACKHHLPLHPALFLGPNPLFQNNEVLKFFKDAGQPRVIKPRDS